MKPLPDLTDEAAMLLRGRLSTLGKERSDTMIALRDAYTALDGCAWDDVVVKSRAVMSLSERMSVIALMWKKTTTEADEAAMRREQA
tara:strand:+ start:1390 stop:1650 length:261 start_codon:yes stop_codon:yes gene_type:complete